MDSKPSNDINNAEVTSLDNFIKSGFKTLMESIKQCSAFPGQDEFNFFLTHETFKNEIHSEGIRILTLMNKIQKHYGMESNFKTRLLEHKTELLIETNDSIIEKVANNIDEINGIKKCNVDPKEFPVVSDQLPFNGSWNGKKQTCYFDNKTENLKCNSNSSMNLITTKITMKPQKLFTETIDNSNLNAWKPRIKDKPNSIKPLAIFLEYTDKGEEFSHPYEVELQKFHPSDEQLNDQISTTVQQPKKVEETNFIEINSSDQLKDLICDLHRYNVIAVDLEHHSYRSFMGLTCLMQISTADTDYIIDTLSLRNDSHLLNEIFTKPSILKLFHGADSDILWLQRDLSLYVVNMFDTHQAAKILEYQNLSLAFLVEKFCRIKLNKQYRLADWRIRPLPEYLKRYAREDTHYLIYIYEMLRVELLKKSGGTNKLLEIVYQRSTDICGQKYFKPKWTEECHLDSYRMCKRMFDNRQMDAFKELFKWRDEVAREEDESIGYVLPNHMLVQISEILPREVQGILACCNPIPPLVKCHLLDIHHIIMKAREKPLVKPILSEDTRARGSTLQLQQFNLENPLHCPHDLSKSEDFRDDLPTLLDDSNHNILRKNIISEKCGPIFSLFKKNGDQCTDILSDKKKLLSPFERYQFVKPFILDEEEKQITLNATTDSPTTQLSNTKIKEECDTKNDTICIDDDIDKISQNLENLVKEDTSEEKRIASIRKHFVLLSKKTAEDKELAERKQQQLYQKLDSKNDIQCLSEIGKIKKRKRSNSESELVEENILENRLLHPAPYHTSDKYVSLGKRPNRNCDQQNTTSLNQIIKKKKGVRRNMIKKEMKRNAGRDYQTKLKVEEPENTSTYLPKIAEKPSSSKTICQNTRKRKLSMKKNNEDTFEAFNYSSVDFRQFQGGASGVSDERKKRSVFKNKAKGQKSFKRPNMNHSWKVRK